MNKAIICGNLGGDPEIRYTQNQKAVATFNVATTEHGKEGKQTTDWHRVVVWEKLAENCAKYLEKGKKVLVEGRMSIRSYEDKQGVKRSTFEIVAHSVEFLSPKSEKQITHDSEPTRSESSMDDVPF